MALNFPDSPVAGTVFGAWRYDGVKWGAVSGVSGGGAGGDITAVFAGAGLTGGGTEGDVSVALEVPVALARGGTGATDAATALGNLGGAPLASPTLTGDPKAPTPATADNDTSIATTAYVRAQGYSTNDVGRNLIHNPMFNIAQRGAGPFTTDLAYTLDRWQISLNTDTLSVSPFALGDPARLAIGHEDARQVMRLIGTGNVAAAAYSRVWHHIEGVARLAGKTVTVSFYGVQGSGNKIGINLYQNFGSGGSPSIGAWVTATGQAVTLTGTWARYSVTFDVPNIQGKTLGTAGNDSTQLVFFLSSGANTNAVAGNIGVQSGTTYIWGVQLEIGSTMTPLEKPDPADDLARCQRFYQNGSASISSYGTTGWGYGQRVPFVVTMRATPTMVLSSPGGGNVTAHSVSAYDGGFYTPIVQASALGSYAGSFSWTATADL